MNEFEDETLEEVSDVKHRHRREVLSRRTKEEQLLTIHQAIDKLREEYYEDGQI